MRIVITNTKGGVGKTTVALYLAEAVQRSGRSVEVWDADPQGSAIAWSDYAEGDETPLSFPVLGIHPRKVSQPSTGESWTIVDTAPGDPATINAAITRADLVVIPTGPGGADVDRAVETMNGVPAGIPALLLLNSYSKSEKESWETWRSIQASDMAAFDTRIPRRAAIQRSYGKPIYELHGFERLLDEIIAVHEHITQEA
ncbi:ParA family protein [Brevibacterium picturae]|uniref:ParA family protein n=1 Tax=Brevibacterium picturae TaxID=260553 RepID=A0ABP4NP26_9MICO